MTRELRAFIKANYLTMFDKDIAKATGYSVKHVKDTRQWMGLWKKKLKHHDDSWRGEQTITPAKAFADRLHETGHSNRAVIDALRARLQEVKQARFMWVNNTPAHPLHNTAGSKYTEGRLAREVHDLMQEIERREDVMAGYEAEQVMRGVVPVRGARPGVDENGYIIPATYANGEKRITSDGSVSVGASAGIRVSHSNYTHRNR